MRKLNIFFLALILYGISSQSLLGQIILDSYAKRNLNEKVFVQTDREIYCAGEYISFYAFNISKTEMREVEWSKVLYVEIITPNGKPIVHAKYKYDSIGAYGELLIPKEVLTGNYYLRAYTKWMRNYSPYSFFYQTIKIINPYHNELLQNTLEYEEKLNVNIKKQKPSELLQIASNKNQFSKHEDIYLNINLLNTDILQPNFTVSVIKKGLEEKNTISFTESSEVSNSKIEFIPETRSISITGMVVNSSNSIAIPFIPLNLTIFNSINEPYRTITDKNGHFYFSLPNIIGVSEIFISVVNKNDKLKPVILVDNDYCTKNIQLPFIPFSVDSLQKPIYEELCINSQLSEIYNTSTLKLIENKQAHLNNPFYGAPAKTIILEKYVELPRLEDYFNELLPYVSIKRQKGKRFFEILGPYSELKIYEPLVLVDFIAISNVEWILSINPRKIERIDVVEKPFIRGSATFGGIINIISKKKDFAGVNLPSSGKFFSYEMFSENFIKNYTPVNENRIPDLRNTLFWDYLIIENNNLQLKIKAGDTAGEYIAILKGFDKSFNEVMNYCVFDVK